MATQNVNKVLLKHSMFARAADQALKISARMWVLTATGGMWLFALYVAVYYGSLIARGGLEGLNASQLPRAYIPDEVFSNFAIAAHLLLSITILGGGPLQLIPQIRNRFPAFHKWNGRAYLSAVVAASVSGLYMIWIRGSSVGDISMHLGISLNAVFILVFAVVAFRFAKARKINRHRRWAMRLFIASNGVWFARIGLWLWIFLTDGAGINFKSFTGPFLTFLNFAQFLLPLAVLELYLYTRERSGPRGQISMAILLTLLTIAMGLGIHQVAMHAWLPRMHW